MTIDLRTLRGNGAAQPGNSLSSSRTEVHTRESSWPEIVRAHARRASNPRQALYQTTVAGRGAWYSLLDLSPQAVVLDLNCGTGSISQLLSPLVAQIFATDNRIAELRVARERFRRFNAENNLCIVIRDESGPLPFGDASFDFVLFADEAIPLDSRRTLLREVRRIMKADGQIFMTGVNRFQLADRGPSEQHRWWRREGATYSGYQRMLATAGFDTRRFYSLLRSADFLHRIIPLDEHDASWRPPRPARLKERIKADRRAAECYGVLAEAAPARSDSFVQRLLAEVAAGLTPGHGATPTLREYRVSRKDKLILHVRFGERDTFVRLPLMAGALASERRNANVLRSLSQAQREPVQAPTSLLTGQYQNSRYFVESSVPGAPVAQAIRDDGLAGFIDQIQALLDQLNPPSVGPELRMLEGALYDAMVASPLHKIAQLISHRGRRETLSRYFSSQLEGARLPVGLVHGDFSVSNLFHTNQTVTSLIDWESGRMDGLPIIDAINFVESLDRLASGDRVGETIPRLASGQFRSSLEKRFLLDRYERWSIDPSLHESLVYLKWLHHMAYLVDFWLPYDEAALARFVTPVVESIIRPR